MKSMSSGDWPLAVSPSIGSVLAGSGTAVLYVRVCAVFRAPRGKPRTHNRHYRAAAGEIARVAPDRITRVAVSLVCIGVRVKNSERWTQDERRRTIEPSSFVLCPSD